MKKTFKFAACCLIATFSFYHIEAQEVASLTSSTYPSAKAVPENPVAPVVNKEVQILVKNSAEKAIIVFAGPKEEIRNPKVQTYGGLSKNTVYVQTNDVICLMNQEAKPMACASIKPGITSVEINTSATTISAK